MDNRSEVREFLTSRRAKVTPHQLGCRNLSSAVPGLRRSEVAALAGMSVEYYAKLERGSVGARQRAFLTRSLVPSTRRSRTCPPVHLAHAADGTSAVMRPRAAFLNSGRRPSLQWTLDSITTGPAIVGKTGPTCSPSTTSAGRSTSTSTTRSTPRPTLPGSHSSTPPPSGSTPTGIWPPTPRCQLRTARDRTARQGAQDLSAICPPAVTTSAAVG